MYQVILENTGYFTKCSFVKKSARFFFDLFDLYPNVYSVAFSNYISKYNNTYYSNELCIQSLESNVCGQWCLMYYAKTLY